MHTYLQNLERRLRDDQKDLLRRIWAPTVVGTPLADSRRDVCILPDGEIRSYGQLYASSHTANDGQTAYLASTDGGLSWNIHYSNAKMNACTYLEKAGIYIAACDRLSNNHGIDTGLYVYRSAIGPDDPDPEVIELTKEPYICAFLPQESCFTNRIWFTAQQPDGTAVFFYSDDAGKTWTMRVIPIPDRFDVVFPHKGLRWCKGSGAEPHAVELDAHRMMMILRTPLDCFYKCYSSDGGDTWSTPEPSEFYGTNTTAFLLRLTNGRIMTFWNNTKPLPQPNHAVSEPPALSGVAEGFGENAFTNRDAAHAAISTDGTTFTGFREILLNPIRNASDFRYYGGIKTSADKSVHQFQAFELPFNKILVSAGQNVASRRLIIFDIGWLEETARTEDFIEGMINLTTHTYLKSIPGCHWREVGNGHCAMNRTYAAFPMPDPDGGYGEMLSITWLPDERTINGIGGAEWNFPASKTGRVSAEMKIIGRQARIILTDRWYNVCDPYAAAQSPFWFELDAKDLGNDFVTVNVDYDTESGLAQVSVGEAPFFRVRMTAPCPTGISYLLLQCTTPGDTKGFYVKRLEKK